MPSIKSKKALYCLFLAVKRNSRRTISLFIKRLYLTFIYSIFTSILGKISLISLNSSDIMLEALVVFLLEKLLFDCAVLLLLVSKLLDESSFAGREKS